MGEVGLLAEDSRVELIGGEIVEMTPIGSKHLACVTNLTHLLVEGARGRYFVSVRSSIRLGDDSEPELDLTLLRERPSQRDEELPSGDDVLTVIEVSDTTLAYDKNIKLPLYAASGIAEVWIFDLPNRCVEVYTEPSPNGYRAMRMFCAKEKVESSAVEGLCVAVDEALA